MSCPSRALGPGAEHSPGEDPGTGAATGGPAAASCQQSEPAQSNSATKVAVAPRLPPESPKESLWGPLSPKHTRKGILGNVVQARRADTLQSHHRAGLNGPGHSLSGQFTGPSTIRSSAGGSSCHSLCSLAVN